MEFFERVICLFIHQFQGGTTFFFVRADFFFSYSGLDFCLFIGAINFIREVKFYEANVSYERESLILAEIGVVLHYITAHYYKLI